MTLQTFNIIELSTAVMTMAGGIALILRQIQQSRCKTCKFCCGVSSCEREVRDLDADATPPPEAMTTTETQNNNSLNDENV